MDFSINIKVMKIPKVAGADPHLPQYATEGAAGLDLAACLKSPQVIAPEPGLKYPPVLPLKCPTHILPV